MPEYAEVTEKNSVSGTAVLVSGSRCVMAAVKAINTTAAAAYLQLFDAAAVADVTVGTTVPRWVVKSAANDPSTDPDLPAGGLKFMNGIVIASTTTALGSTGAAQHVRVAIL